jgi:hypothetical protein
MMSDEEFDDEEVQNAMKEMEQMADKLEKND